jgi:hypothetical protein
MGATKRFCCAMTTPVNLNEPLDPATLAHVAKLICDGPHYRSTTATDNFLRTVGFSGLRGSRVPGTLEALRSATAQQCEQVVLRLADLREYANDRELLRSVVEQLNNLLEAEGLRVAYDGNGRPFIHAHAQDLSQVVGTPADSDMRRFLAVVFPDDIVVSTLGLKCDLEPYIQARINEARNLPRHSAPLSTVLLLGSALEGLLLAVAESNRSAFGKAAGEGLSKKNLAEWKLQELIDVARKAGALDLDVERFSQQLRDFRNYVHPNLGRNTGFVPTQETADICWQVFKAAFEQIRRFCA